MPHRKPIEYCVVQVEDKRINFSGRHGSAMETRRLKKRLARRIKGLSFFIPQQSITLRFCMQHREPPGYAKRASSSDHSLSFVVARPFGMESDLRLSIEARSGARSAGESARRFGGAFANPES